MKKKICKISALAVIASILLSGCSTTPSAAVSTGGSTSGSDTSTVANKVNVYSYADFGTVQLTVNNALLTGDEVEVGSTVLVSVTPDNGYKLNSLTLNGIDISTTKAFITSAGQTYTVFASFKADDESDAGNYLIEFEDNTPIFGVGVGESEILETTVYGPSSSIEFVSSDTRICMVNASTGEVTGIKPGFASVTASLKNDSDLFITKPVFVEPSYISQMIEDYQSDIEDGGAVFDGDLIYRDISLLSTETSVRKNENTEHLLFGDYDINCDLSGVLGQALAFAFSENSEFSSSALSITLTQGYLYTTSKDSDGNYGYYSKTNPLEVVTTLFGEYLPRLGTLLYEMGEISETDFSSVYPIINTMIDFNEDPAVGIQLSTIALSSSATVLSDLRDWALEKYHETNNAGYMLIAFFLPSEETTLTEMSLKYASDTKKCSFVIKAKGEDDEEITFADLSIAAQEDAVVSEDMFTSLLSDFESIDSEISNITTINDKIYNLSYLQQNFDSLYDSIVFSNSKMEYEYINYNTYYYPLIADIENKMLLNSQQVFGPYAVLKFDDGKNDLRNSALAVKNDVIHPLAFVYGQPESKEEETQVLTYDGKYAVSAQKVDSETSLTEDEIITYLSIDDSTGSITILKDAVDEGIVFTVTPTVSDDSGLVPVDFDFVVNTLD
ncbi:MAG: hypothetical protein WCR67_03835 [Bacilli bacterium]